MKKEAILIIPGVDVKESGVATDRLVENIAKRQDIADFTIRKHQLKSQIEVSFKDSRVDKTIDLYEMYWGDVFQKFQLTSFSLGKKCFFGAELMVFWIISPIWRAAMQKNKFLLAGMLLSGVVLVAWFLSVFLLLLTSLMQFLMDEGFDTASTLNDFIQTSPFWGVSTIVLSSLLIKSMINVSYFSMNYLKNPNLRNSIHQRIEFQVQHLVQLNEYERITIFSHSLGTLFAVNFLSDFENKEIGAPRIRSITTGSPISFFMNRSEKLGETMKAYVNNEVIEEWVDYFSYEDWLCSYKKAHEEDHSLDFDTGWLSTLNLTAHNLYFSHPEVNEKLISD